MKKIFFIFILGISSLSVFADDVTALVENTDIGTNNGSITITISAGFAPYTFLWTGPDGFTSSEQNISDLVAGEYCLTVTDNLCGIADLCVTVEEGDQNAIETFSITNVTIFPNPFDGGFTISLNLFSPGELIFGLKDLQGKTIVSKQRSFPAGENQITVDLEYPIPGGDYLLTIMDNKFNAVTHQIIHMK